MNISSLQNSIESLRTSTGSNSVTPEVLASIFNEMLGLVQSIDSSGLSSNVTSALNKANSALTTASDALSRATSAQTSADNAGTVARNAVTALESLTPQVNEVIQSVSELSEILNELNNSIGVSGGIAPLDEQGMVPSSHLPSYVDDVIEVESIADVTTPESGKVYLEIATNKTYRWGGTQFVVIGSDLALGDTESTAFPGNRGKQLETNLSTLTNSVSQHISSFVNVNLFLDIQETYADVILAASAIISAKGVYFFYKGMVLTFLGNNGWESYQYIGVSGFSVQILNASYWKRFGGSAAVGNCYNVTNEHPLESGFFYDSAKAVTKTFESGVAALGLQITFAVANNSWKTLQYVGSSVEEQEFENLVNWIDLAGLSAGTEAVLNIEHLCGSCQAENPDNPGYYTLNHALNALKALQDNTGITYAKSGLIITYPIAQYSWETKQFRGNASDLTDNTLWSDFGAGGGGTSVEVTDEPEERSRKAFSAGGAYTCIPANIVVDNSESGVAKLHLVNEKGEPIGDEQTILVGTGSGGAGGTVIAISFEASPLTGALGTPLVARAAIRSTTISSGVESENGIERVEVVDRDANLVVYSATVNKPSSSDMTDYSFEIDLSPLFTSAQSRRFKLVATDDAGNTQAKNLTVTAVDVTITSTQVLNYNSDNLISPTTNEVRPSLYKFANNVSSQGIRAYVDIKINGVWQNIHTAVIYNQYSQNVIIRPLELGLAHGAYPIRMYGEDVASRARGNTIYSTIMVVESGNNTPIVAIRYNDNNNGNIKLYESVSLEVAAYSSNSLTTTVAVAVNGTIISSISAHRSTTYTISQQVQGYRDGDELEYVASSGETTTEAISLIVAGSAISASLKDGAAYSFDFATRSNSDANHTIQSGDYKITPTGANWRTNGFISYLGEQTLRVAENMTAVLNHSPFATPNIETTGYAIQFAFASRNVVDERTKLLECYDESAGAGFYVTGSHIGIFCKGGEKEREERAYRQGEKVTVAVVIEPASFAIERSGVKYSFIKLYLNGELAACIGYVTNRAQLSQSKQITFNGRYGDMYLYYLIGWNDYFLWAQAFDNYLVKLSDTAAMIREFDYEDILVAQEGENRPSHTELYARGIPYIIEAPYDGSDITALDNTTATNENNYITLYYYNPARPWTNFKATSVRSRNQGTTSSKRPVKNKRYYLAKNKGKNKDTAITLLNPDNSTIAGRRAIELAKINKVQIGDNTIPVDIITVKVDYSDSTNANDCGICDMMNATISALGGNYLTPAQRAYTGVFTQDDIRIEGLSMNHSTANHSVATFRCEDPDLLTSPVYFHAKGNWKEDKGEQTALGFKDTPGYNLGCLNYGDFVEFFGTRDESLDDIEARFKSTSGLDTTAVYLLSLYCGANYRFMRYIDEEWTATTGSMKQVAGKWVVTGDVLNPVDGFELLNYQGMCWWQGVSSIDDMMEMRNETSSWCQKLVDSGDITATQFPAWTYYFECMIDDDQLAMDYALGKKVPYNLYRVLQFLDSCDYSKVEGWQDIWKKNMYKYISPHSALCYDIATDYNGMLDQRAKNMQPMWFLEDGFSVEDGVYSSEYALKMYLNKIYDSDGANGKDNDGGCTFDPETDPNILSPDNPYAGYGSVLFNNIYGCQEVWLNAEGTPLSLRTVAAAMRNIQTNLDGRTIKPFSPEGAMYVFHEKRLLVWPKKVSSYDGIRKYISFSATSDTLYFYALQGLGLTSLPSFIEKRWRYRDGFFQTGNFFSGTLSGRVSAVSENAKIRFTAAKSGYFGIGNDASGNLSEAIYLEAGESAEFTNFSKVEGALLYIYQADRMSMLDLSDLSLSDTFPFSVMTLCSELILGSATHIEKPIGSFASLRNLNLGDMPFLAKLDVRNTYITTIDVSRCPRLEIVNAEDTSLTTISLAETSPISELRLPATMTEVKLIALPDLTYSGIIITSLPNVVRFNVESSPSLDVAKLLKDIIVSQSGNMQLDQVRIIGMPVSGDATELLALISNGVGGTTIDGTRQDKPVIDAVYELTRLYESYEIAEIEAAIDGLTLTTSVDAYITCINEVNDEMFGGQEEVDSVTLDNIDERAFLYYNGETSEEAVASFVEDNVDINTLID